MPINFILRKHAREKEKQRTYSSHADPYSIVVDKFIIWIAVIIIIQFRCAGRWHRIKCVLRSNATSFFRSIMMIIKPIFDGILFASFTKFSTKLEEKWTEVGTHRENEKYHEYWNVLSSLLNLLLHANTIII